MYPYRSKENHELREILSKTGLEADKPGDGGEFTDRYEDVYAKMFGNSSSAQEYSRAPERRHYPPRPSSEHDHRHAKPPHHPGYDHKPGHGHHPQPPHKPGHDHHSPPHKPGHDHHSPPHKPGHDHHSPPHKPGHDHHSPPHKPGHDHHSPPHKPGHDHHSPPYKPGHEHPSHYPAYIPTPPSGKPPSLRPPEYIPSREAGLSYVDQTSIRRCEGKLVFMWLRNGKSNWMHLTNVSKHSVSGYSWTKMGWMYTGFDLDIIESFYCFG